MSDHNPEFALRDMLEYAREAVELMRDPGSESAPAERIRELAIARLLEIIGEAAGRLPPTIRDSHTRIPWQQIIALRNRLIHGYDSVDMDIVATIVKHDLPVLIQELEGIVAPLSDSDDERTSPS